MRWTLVHVPRLCSPSRCDPRPGFRAEGGVRILFPKIDGDKQVGAVGRGGQRGRYIPVHPVFELRRARLGLVGDGRGVQPLR